ncbi:MAG: hypothetical protein LBH65_05400 [Desulfovibrio sp.]|nr:hypothetical protein [Desulfovibrio sp.]
MPTGLESLSSATTPEAVAEAFLGIPYRKDGAVDETGRYTLFADRSKRFSSPGLNCSGLTLEASRFLLKKNTTLAEAVRDRLGDSGPGAPDGEDWDFGWDLILNISEGLERVFLMPGGLWLHPDTASGISGRDPRGWDIHKDATWKELPGRLKPGYLYLISLSAAGHRKGYGLQHYHVGFLHVAASGEAWFHQTTSKGKVSNRRDLKSASGRDSFKRAFANTGKNRKTMLVLEIPLPE